MVTHAKTSSLTAALHPLYWPTWIGLGLLRLIALLPYPVQWACGHILGIIIWLLPIPQKRYIRINLELCFPELSLQQRKKMLFDNCLSMGMSLIEIAMSWWSSDRALKKIIKIDGLEYLSQALDKQHGVILLSAHFTTLEIGGRLLSLHAPFHVMYRDQKNAAFDYLMTRARQRNYNKAIHRNNIRGLLQSLKTNMPVWYAPDQHFGSKQPVFAPFFNIPAASNPATSRLAKNTGAAIVPLFQQRLPRLRGYRIELFPAIQDFPTDNIENDTHTINLALEKLIRLCPEQYLWAHRRFKSQPDDVRKNIYNKR